ncbi:hypothetical protein CVT26_016209 [Gymnopilus dilepis]|uniref:Uncharacterized protein n=1 Tax=Gymnopilus dilepis TaxID=231916 RepID=A0A409XZ54_9AGAR|nr:hypothetical protein CVT26_016209 [Gymnopilus dilepis]
MTRTSDLELTSASGSAGPAKKKRRLEVLENTWLGGSKGKQGERETLILIGDYPPNLDEENIELQSASEGEDDVPEMSKGSPNRI